MKLLEDLKQGSWEVIIYILIKALTYILKRKAWLCGEQIVGGQTQKWGDQGGDNGRSPMTDAGVWVEGFSSKAATGPHIAFVTIRKKSPIPSGGSEQQKDYIRSATEREESRMTQACTA